MGRHNLSYDFSLGYTESTGMADNDFPILNVHTPTSSFAIVYSSKSPQRWTGATNLGTDNTIIPI